MVRKFNCTFSIRVTVEKTYIVTNLPINIPKADLDSHNLTLEDIAADEIRELFDKGVLAVDNYELIQTDVDINFVKFVKTPKEIKED
jgi:hypothetical protein